MVKKIIVVGIFFAIFCVPVFAEDVEIAGADVYNRTTEQILSGKLILNPIEIINIFLKDIYSEIANTKGTIKSLLLICVASGILRILPDSFGENEVSPAASFACFCITAILAMRIFSDTIGYATEVVHLLCDFITKFEPIFIGLLVTGGAVVQATAFSPVLSGSIYVLSIFVDKCILPMTYFSAILGVVNSIGAHIEIGTLKKLIDSVSKWILTGVLTLFCAILSIYGFGTSAGNAVATKGLKFAVGSFVPVVGGLLSDTVETVLAGTNLLKNAVGTAGMIAVITMACVPIVKILIMMLMLKITAAAVEPFSDKKIMSVLLCISETLQTAFSMVITVAALFVISIGIMLIFTGVSL